MIFLRVYYDIIKISLGFITISGLVTFFFFIFSVIGLGPLAPLLFKGTLAIRGDYWRAGFSMAKDHLLTGVGPDQFGTWYRFYRHQEALTRVNAEVVTNSAHNGYLDFAANLGIIALITYLVLFIMNSGGLYYDFIII